MFFGLADSAPRGGFLTEEDRGKLVALARDGSRGPAAGSSCISFPAYCPHLNPIERLWGIMHRNLTHNKTYATCAQFADATLGFLREKVPRRWATYRDSVRQFSHHQPEGFSGHDVNRVYLTG